jgi:transposase
MGSILSSSRPILDLQSRDKHARQQVTELAEAMPEVSHLGAVVGMVTAAVLVSEAGSPARYGCAQAYLKALGLNLREKSSGAHQGRPRFTKRGSSRARMVLWLATADSALTRTAIPAGPGQCSGHPDSVPAGPGQYSGAPGQG